MTQLRLEAAGDGVAVLTLEGRGNAMDPAFFRDLADAAATVRRDGTRALVVTGAGSVFCAGYDLAQLPGLLSLSVPAFLDLEDSASGAIAAVHRLPFPVVAAVNGAAAGGGLSLALAADIRIAADTASLSAAFAKVGFSVGELGTSWMLSRLVGPGLAAELAFTGRGVRADEALRIGLVDRVAPAASLLDDALTLARDLAAPHDDRIAKRGVLVDDEIASFEAAMLARTGRG
jgi:enoyl-CoA hydratase/carnithine racemase